MATNVNDSTKTISNDTRASVESTNTNASDSVKTISNDSTKSVKSVADNTNDSVNTISSDEYAAHMKNKTKEVVPTVKTLKTVK